MTSAATHPRQHARSRRRNHFKCQPRLERLEDRLALSGFGPEDGAYITETWPGSYSSIEIRSSDQAIVVGGTSRPAGSESEQMAIARYDASGNPDTTFAGTGRAVVGPLGSTSMSLTLQADGKVVATGLLQGNGPGSSFNDVAVARLNLNGSADQSFSGDGWTTLSTASGSYFEAGSGVGLQSNGDIIVAGSSKLSSGASAALVASFKSSGAVDSGKDGFGQISQGKASGYWLGNFNSSPMVDFADVAILPDNRVLAIGTRTVNAATYSNAIFIARFTANGLLDTSFASAGYATFTSLPTSNGSAMALQPDGKVVVVGVGTGMDGSGDFVVARYNASGALDGSFGNGAGFVRLDADGSASQTNEQAFGVTVQSDGKIVVAGKHFLQANTSQKNVLVFRLNSNGSPDSDFAPGGYKLASPPEGHSFGAEDVVLQADGSIIVAGFDTDLVNRRANPLLMRFSGQNANTASSDASAQIAYATDEALMLLMYGTSPTTGKRK